MASETIRFPANDDEPERVFERDQSYVSLTVPRFMRSFESDAQHPPEGLAYVDSRVIFGDGRLDFSDRFGCFGKGQTEVYEGREVRVSIVGNGDDSATYVGSGFAFGLSLQPERFEALWNAATTLPDAELQVYGDLDVYRLKGSHDGVAYLSTEERNRVGPVSVRLTERAPNPDASASATLPSPDRDGLAKRLRTISNLLWAIFAAIVVLAISVG